MKAQRKQPVKTECRILGANSHSTERTELDQSSSTPEHPAHPCWSRSTEPPLLDQSSGLQRPLFINSWLPRASSYLLVPLPWSSTYQGLFGALLCNDQVPPMPCPLHFICTTLLFFVAPSSRHPEDPPHEGDLKLALTKCLELGIRNSMFPFSVSDEYYWSMKWTSPTWRFNHTVGTLW